MEISLLNHPESSVSLHIKVCIFIHLLFISLINYFRKSKSIGTVTTIFYCYFKQTIFNVIPLFLIGFFIYQVKYYEYLGRVYTNEVNNNFTTFQLIENSKKIFYVYVMGSVFQQLKFIVFAFFYCLYIRKLFLVLFEKILNRTMKIWHNKVESDKLIDGDLQYSMFKGIRGMDKILEIFALYFLSQVLGIILPIQKIIEKMGVFYVIPILSALLIFTLSFIFYTKYNLKLRYKKTLIRKELFNRISEVLNNFSLIKISNQEQKEFKEVKSLSKKIKSIIFKSQITALLFTFLIDTMFTFICYFLILQYLNSNFDNLGKGYKDLVIFIGYLERILGFVKKFLYSYFIFLQDSQLVVENFRTTFTESGKSIENFEGLEMININIIENDINIIKNVSLKINPTKKYLLTGKNGAGKSTILKTIAGLKMYNGVFKFNNSNFGDYRISSIRNLISYVPQDLILFDKTVKYNLTYNIKNYNEDYLQELCTKFELQSKLDDFVGENGKELSNEEKSKILIIRAVLKDSKLYLIDEPTCYLNENIKCKIMEVLFDVLKDKTVIMTLHESKFNDKFDEIYQADKNGLALLESNSFV